MLLKTGSVSVYFTKKWERKVSEVILYTKYRIPVAFTLYANNATKITYLKMALGHIYMAFTCNFQMHIHHWINGLRSVTTPTNININSQSPLKRLGASPGNQICCNNLGNGICKSNFILKLNLSPVVIHLWCLTSYSAVEKMVILNLSINKKYGYNGLFQK